MLRNLTVSDCCDPRQDWCGFVQKYRLPQTTMVYHHFPVENGHKLWYMHHFPTHPYPSMDFPCHVGFQCPATEFCPSLCCAEHVVWAKLCGTRAIRKHPWNWRWKHQKCAPVSYPWEYGWIWAPKCAPVDGFNMFQSWIHGHRVMLATKIGLIGWCKCSHQVQAVRFLFNSILVSANPS